MPNRTVVAIHQPNFFPWLGYFDKISRADIFIILDDVQFPKKGGTWINRVQLLVNRQANWVTVPIVRTYHGTRRIFEIEINGAFPWREQILKTIQSSYGRFPYFKAVFPFVSELINQPTDMLVSLNMIIIRKIVNALMLDNTQMILSSSLNVKGHATDLLIDLIKSVGGTSYLCGGGSTGYLEEEKFSAGNIELLYQNFNHPIYSQWNTRTFIPGLSIIDALMNCDFANVKALISNE